MKRRTFLSRAAIGVGAAVCGLGPRAAGRAAAAEPAARPFTTKFSPDFGLFEEVAGKDVVDQIKWGRDHGFRAWENTQLRRRPVEEQERISRAVQQLGMEFGQFVGTMNFKEVTFAGRDAAVRDEVLKQVQSSVEVAKRMNTRFVHNVLGQGDPKLPHDFQMANATELLKRVAAIYEPHGIVMVMESMNWKKNHAGMFLRTVPQAYALAKAVGSPSVKVLFDFYHVQIEEGNLLPTLDYAWDEIAYIQMGDTPGRHEPTSGEINFPNVLQHVHAKGYRGFVGLEHTTSKPGPEGELAALAAYRAIDPK